MKEAKVVRRQGTLASLSYEPDPSVSGGGGGRRCFNFRVLWPLVQRQTLRWIPHRFALRDDVRLQSIRDALVQKREA